MNYFGNAEVHFLAGDTSISDKLAARFPYGIYAIKKDGGRYAYPTTLADSATAADRECLRLMELNKDITGRRFTYAWLPNAPKLPAARCERGEWVSK